MLIDERILQLKQSLETARTEMLPNLEEANSWHIKGYILLVHAEFESFIEDIGVYIADLALSLWIESSKSTIALSYLIMFFTPEKVQGDFLTRLHKCHKNYKNNVKGNNGIKSDHVFKLLGKLGLALDLVDVTLDGDLDSFGTKRGEIAHSNSGQITTSLNASDIVTSVENMSKGLSKIGNEVNRVLS